MVNYIHSGLFNDSSVDKNLVITRQDGTRYDNESLFQEQLEINESLCSTESLYIGSCEASSVKFKVKNDNRSWKGEKIRLEFIINHDTYNPFRIGTYTVDSDVPTAEKSWREVTAYDELFTVLNNDYTEWYRNLWNDRDSMKLKDFRDEFFRECGITQVVASLVNDNMDVTQTLSDSDMLTGKTILNAICEINGCFGHINRDGNFEYIELKSGSIGLYPSEALYPSATLYPSDGSSVPTEQVQTSEYVYPLDYEDYVVGQYTELKIRDMDTEDGITIGTAGSRYVISGNFLLFGKTETEIRGIGSNILSVISAIRYVPIKSLKKLSNPCYEVGDKIVVYLDDGGTIESYILERTITGIQRLTDLYMAKGTEEQIVSGNTLQNQISQLRSKAKSMDDSIEGTKVLIQTLDDRIILEASRTSAAVGELSSRISITDSMISSKVSKGDVVSEINQTSDAIIMSAGRLIITSGNLILDSLGNATFSGNLSGATGNFSGSVSASSGNIGGWLIGNGYIEGTGGTYISTKSDPTIYQWQGEPYQTSVVHGKIMCGKYSGQYVPDGSGGYCDLSVAGFFSKDINTSPGYLFAVDIGNSTVTTNTGVFTGSDRRLKTDIQEILDDYAVELIDGLRPSSYRMKGGKRVHSGFIADELKETAEKILGSVDDFAAYAKVTLDENDEYGAIRYEELIAPLVKYCQVLKARVDKLENGGC